MTSKEYASAISCVHEHLDEGDDPAYWTELISTVLREIDSRWAADAPSTRGISVCVARVSHWSRPNQTRWTLGGGFAWPESYTTHADEHPDWRLWLARRKGEHVWSTSSREPKSKRGYYRAFLAAPSGTTDHPQGSAILIWRPECPYEIERGSGTIRQLYGLRRVSDAWEVVAHSEFGERRK